MGDETLIAWANHTYNPWVGCTKVGLGCVGCYAEAYDMRYSPGVSHWGAGRPRRLTSEATRKAPYKWNKAAEKAGVPARVFSHSLSDFFDNEVPDEWRQEECKIWRSTPWLRWIVLTKRPGNIFKMLPKDWNPIRYRNVGFCVSVSSQREYDRDVPTLAQVDARWLGVSIEPQIESIKLDNVGFSRSDKIRWIITGGASVQPGYHPPSYNVYWALDLITQCRQAEIACFVKQMGSNPIECEGGPLHFNDKKGADPLEWPEAWRVQEFPPELTE